MGACSPSFFSALKSILVNLETNTLLYLILATANQPLKIALQVGNLHESLQLEMCGAQLAFVCIHNKSSVITGAPFP